MTISDSNLSSILTFENIIYNGDITKKPGTVCEKNKLINIILLNIDSRAFTGVVRSKLKLCLSCFFLFL